MKVASSGSRRVDLVRFAANARPHRIDLVEGGSLPRLLVSHVGTPVHLGKL